MKLLACLLLATAIYEAQAQSTTCNCGWVNSGRIVNGQEAPRNKYPMMVSLQTTSGFAFCGGTIVTPWHVLTAAHCTEGQSPYGMRVKVGAHNVKTSGQTYNVARILMHERYNSRTAVFDISLVVTASQIAFNQVVGPACLPSSRLNIVGDKLTALGWGRTTTGGSASDVLREVQLTVVNFSDCKRKWNGGPREDNNMCTYEVRKDTCQGDSGGPLIWLDKSINRYTLAALVSYGPAQCGGNLPAVNTDVSVFLDWINSKIAASKPGVAACRKR